jgi:hypothetical protein
MGDGLQKIKGFELDHIGNDNDAGFRNDLILFMVQFISFGESLLRQPYGFSTSRNKQTLMDHLLIAFIFVFSSCNPQSEQLDLLLFQNWRDGKPCRYKS